MLHQIKIIFMLPKIIFYQITPYYLITSNVMVLFLFWFLHKMFTLTIIRYDIFIPTISGNMN